MKNYAGFKRIGLDKVAKALDSIKLEDVREKAEKYAIDYCKETYLRTKHAYHYNSIPVSKYSSLKRGIQRQLREVYEEIELDEWIEYESKCSPIQIDLNLYGMKVSGLISRKATQLCIEWEKLTFYRLPNLDRRLPNINN